MASPSSGGHVASFSDSVRGGEPDMIDLQVHCLNGEGFTFRIPPSTLGREVRKMVSEKLPSKPGARVTLHGASKLILWQRLEEQGIVGQPATLSCTLCPTDLYAAWSFVEGHENAEEDCALEGVTWLEGGIAGEYLNNLPECLESLRFGDKFNQSIDHLRWPSSLQDLTLGYDFNQRLEGASFPSSLRSLTFGVEFNQSLEGVALPSNLQCLTFGHDFNQSLEGVSLPSSLKTLTFGGMFNQKLAGSQVS